MVRDPIHQGEYSCRDLQAVLPLGMAGPRCRELGSARPRGEDSVTETALGSDGRAGCP